LWNITEFCWHGHPSKSVVVVISSSLVACVLLGQGTVG
jgi:hypothetical protein